jgi:hypothetical protein
MLGIFFRFIEFRLGHESQDINDITIFVFNIMIWEDFNVLTFNSLY